MSDERLTDEETEALRAVREHWGPPETVDEPWLVAERRAAYSALDKIIAGRGDTKIKLNTSDPETRATWEACLRAKEEVASWPAWKRSEDQPRPLAAIVDEAAARFDSRPAYRASIETQRELGLSLDIQRLANEIHEAHERLGVFPAWQVETLIAAIRSKA